MITKENLFYAEELMDSIKCGLDKIKNGSEVEKNYLNEKIEKLHRLHFIAGVGYTAENQTKQWVKRFG